MRRLTTLLAAMLLLALSASPAAAQYAEEDEEVVSVSDITVVPGEEVTVSGEGFTPGSTVTVALDTAVLGSTTVAEEGTFSVTVTIPTTAACPGDNTLDITSDAGDAASVGISIVCPVAEAGVVDEAAGPLAVTGANFTVGMALVVGLLAAGGVALYATRKKDAAEL